MLKAGGWEKLKLPPWAACWGATEGAVERAGDVPPPPPNANTPVLLEDAPNAVAPPNWKPGREREKRDHYFIHGDLTHSLLPTALRRQ